MSQLHGTTEVHTQPKERVRSLDQFRGYSVAGMFVVNFLGHFAVTHHLLKHNNTHFSWADSIMPSFILISGYSYRLTFIKRSSSPSVDMKSVRLRYLSRSLGLVLLSLMFFGFGGKVDSYSQLSLSSLAGLLAALFKANLWEVLAIIGACQIILLPLVNASITSRLMAMACLASTHILLTGWFNWNFVYGLPNSLDAWLGTTGKRAWDGGVFGLLSWSEIMLMGTLLPDLVAGLGRKRMIARLTSIAIALMVLGYVASCLTRLYDTQAAQTRVNSISRLSALDGQNDKLNSTPPVQFSPVMPDWNRLAGRSWSTWLAEPPLVPAPPADLRTPNYWVMDKRIVSQSFVFFSAGFAILVYSLFVWLSDVKQLAFGPFSTFGQNPLAAYLIHYLVTDSVSAIFPRDSAAVWATAGMLLSVWVTYLFVNFLSKRGLFLRL